MADSDLVDTLLRLALLGSVWVLYLLLGLGVISLAIVIERWWFFSTNRIDLRAVTEQLDAHLGRAEVDEAEAMLRDTGSVETDVAARALASARRDGRDGEHALATQLALHRPQTERFLTFLGTLGNNAPFLGLLGTVLGIIRAFHELAQHGEGGVNVVMAGISEALVATAVGLVIALPAVIAFNHFSRRADQVAANAEALSRIALSWRPAGQP